VKRRIEASAYAVELQEQAAQGSPTAHRKASIRRKAATQPERRMGEARRKPLDPGFRRDDMDKLA
jgi:hypothetical protein